MPRDATPLLTRLRRHRGLWVLAVAVLLLKLASSSICLGDRPAAGMAVAQAAGIAVAAADVQVDDACLLGEAGECHCACAHALTLTSGGVSLPAAPVLARLLAVPLAAGRIPAATGSLLRPPIA